MRKANSEAAAGGIAYFEGFGAKPVAELLAGARLDGEGALTQQICRLMRGLIVNLELLPNQFLSEKEVAAILKVSRTPVREAFIRLSEDGLLNIVPKSGTYVSPIDINRAFEGYLLRSSLESAGAMVIAERGSETDIGVLRTELERQKKCLRARNCRESFYVLDQQFHGAIFVAANLPNIKRLVDVAKFEVDRIKNLRRTYRVTNTEQALYEEHVAIVDAIVARDAERIKKVFARHFAGMNDSIAAIAREERFWGLFHTYNNGAKSMRRGR